MMWNRPRFHDLTMMVAAYLLALCTSLALTGLAIVYVPHIGLCIILNIPLLLFDLVLALFLLFALGYRKNCIKQWINAFGKETFDVWTLRCDLISPSPWSDVHCGISRDEIILVTSEEWTMSRDWPLDWIESFNYDSENKTLRLQLRDRPVLILRPRSKFQAMRILKSYRKHSAKIEGQL